MNKDSNYGGSNMGVFSRYGKRTPSSADTDTDTDTDSESEMKDHRSMMYENGDSCTPTLFRSTEVISGKSCIMKGEFRVWE